MNTRIFSPLKVAAFMFITVFVMAACDNTENSEANDTLPEDDENTLNDNEQNSDNMNLQEEQFITEAAGINVEEIQMGELAVEKGTHQDVKSLGEMMRDDHQDMLDDLINIGEQKELTVPTDLTPEAQKKFNELKGAAKGKAFDIKYAQMMVDGHKKAIERFETAANLINDPDVVALIRTTMPKLRMHLEHSQECLNKVNGDNVASR